MTRPCARLVCAILLLALAACGEPARVDGRTLAEHLAVLDAARPPARASAIRTIGRFGAAGDAAVDRLAGLVRDDPELRVAAADALGEIGTEAAQDRLIAMLDAPATAVDAIPPAACAAARIVPPPRYADAVRRLAQRAPARAARLLWTDDARDAALADPGLRRDVVVALAARIDALDPRSVDAVVRRLAELGAAAAGHEDLLAHAWDRGTAREAVVAAWVAIATPDALAIVAERATPPWPAQAETLLRGAAELAAATGDPERGLRILDRARADDDPLVRAAAIRALAALAAGAPTSRPRVLADLESAAGDPHPMVESCARETWAALCADGVLDSADAARRWARLAQLDADTDRARRVVAALGGAGLPADETVAGLAAVAAAARPAVAAAAERALANFDTPAARSARLGALLRPDAVDATRRFAAWVREESTTFEELAGALRESARSDTDGRLATLALGAVDDRAVDDADPRRLEAFEQLLHDATAQTTARVSAARRLRVLAPRRATLRLSAGTATFRAELRTDKAARDAPLADLAPALGALLARPGAGPLRLDGAGLRDARHVVFLDAEFRARDAAVLAPGATIARDGVGGAVVLPAGVAAAGAGADAWIDGVVPDLIRALAR